MATVDKEEDELIPRDYQTKLMQIAINENSIIFLPTGTGKTFIATMVLKHFGGISSDRPVEEGGKISCMLVNTVALVEQHQKVLQLCTHFKIGAYSGDMNVDDWSDAVWRREINSHQVLIMTAQILLNLVESSILSLNDMNLLIFDECHRGVSDHCMRQIMFHFKDVDEPPRVLGLTATLINKSCKPHQVPDIVKSLETTFHSKIATVDELRSVLGYRTNPKEVIRTYVQHQPTLVDKKAIVLLEYIEEKISKLKIDSGAPVIKRVNMLPLEPEKGLKSIVNLIKDTVIHINMLGTFGGQFAVLAHMIQLERLKKAAQTKQLVMVLDSIITTFTVVHKLFRDEMKPYNEKDKVYKFSSNQVHVLLDSIREYKNKSEEELCGIVFVQRRFTAKILYYILNHVQKFDSDFSYLKPNFMVGYNSNPFNDTRESLYCSKINRKIVSQFVNKEINLLVASNVLEEGVDIPTCTFVNRFDKPTDYRGYIQSKGRARHPKSFYYMLISKDEINVFKSAYITYQQVEETLNNLFIGQNELRDGPSEEDIQTLYNEHIVPPYYTNGPGSAQVNVISAISLLCRYCNTLPRDRYTTYSPNWYVQRIGGDGEPWNHKEPSEDSLFKVVVELPIICPILDPVESGYFPTKKLAKRVAALNACELLHKAGELDDMLLPKQHDVMDDHVDFLFTHWPEVKNKVDGNSNSVRSYSKSVPLILKKQIYPHERVYLHLIELTPFFDSNSSSDEMMNQLYSSAQSFAIITGNSLPKLCEFPVHVTAGIINVNIRINKAVINLKAEQLIALKEFHCLIFRDLLKVLKHFLVIDNSTDAEGLLVVPVNKNSCEIDFNVIETNKALVDQKKEPREHEKLNLNVTEHNYLGKIVTPWYRSDDTIYLVISVCKQLTAGSEFPSEDYDTYVDYFNDKYHARILKPAQPLLFVKALSRRLNCLKPKGVAAKRSKDKSYEEMEEHLVAELCTKQNFPSTLWLQARLLPSILHRLNTLLNAEELRKKIVLESGLGILELPDAQTWKPLKVDPHLINNNIETLKSPKKKENTKEEVLVPIPKIELLKIAQDFDSKRIEKDYLWPEKDEPVDIERNLDVTLMEIQYYENFLSQKVSIEERIVRNHKPNPERLAITYDKHFVEKDIKLLKPKCSSRGLELVDLVKAFTSARGNDVVNLERSETLGDSFLKLSISLYIMLRFPKYEEGRATSLKGRIISNRNLYYIALSKQLCAYIKNSDFTPSFEWKPPYFCVPDVIKDRIHNQKLSSSSLFTVYLSNEEQTTGVLTDQEHQKILEMNDDLEENKHENTYDSLLAFFNLHKIGDKTVADCMESLIGVYFEACGFEGALRILTWLGIVPQTENIQNLLQQEIPNPILNANATVKNVDFFLPSWKDIEKRLGYSFKNRAFLLQALTHSSFTPNRVTNCYQKLEFLGDAILDFLITCHIYETCDGLSPGDLTDLRSALVNNITFAGFTVRCGFHKFLLYCNPQLEELIKSFVQFQESHDYAINNEVLILLEEKDLYLAEHVDVPKVLGDIFEALAGAIFLDSGMKLEVVWSVFYRIMWKEIEAFMTDVPKNPIRLLFETVGAHPRYQPPVSLDVGGTMVALDIMLEGSNKRVYGFGDNKAVAKRAAAKIALRLLLK